MIGYLAISGAAIGLDLALKKKAQAEKQVVYNKGFAGGRHDDKPELVGAVTAAAFALVVPGVIKTLATSGSKIQKTGTALMFGGAIGNVYERLAKGKVTDFISLKTGNKKFDKYVFNPADVCILGGALLSAAGALSKKS